MHWPPSEALVEQGVKISDGTSCKHWEQKNGRIIWTMAWSGAFSVSGFSPVCCQSTLAPCFVPPRAHWGWWCVERLFWWLLMCRQAEERGSRSCSSSPANLQPKPLHSCCYTLEQLLYYSVGGCNAESTVFLRFLYCDLISTIVLYIKPWHIHPGLLFWFWIVRLYFSRSLYSSWFNHQ